MSLTKTKSLEHQVSAIERSKDREYFALFMEQGTGKTHVAIATFVHLFRQKKINGVLVLTPNGVQHNWARNELPLHLPDDIKPRVIIWNPSSTSKSRNLWNWGMDCPEDQLLIVLANIEAVRTARFQESIASFRELRRYMIIVDESTIIKNPKAIQTKECFRLSDRATYTRILTGTPVTQGPLDLWSQCRFLSKTALPYPSFTAFKGEFAIEEHIERRDPWVKKVVGYKNLEVLKQLIQPFSFRVTKDECLDLPEKVYQYRYVELSESQIRHYHDLQKKCIALVNDEQVTTTIILTQLLRLHQITLGYVTDDKQNLQQIPHFRIRELLQLYEELQGKAIVFCRFKEDCRQVYEALVARGRIPVLYHGDIGDAQRHEAVAQFQEGAATDLVATRAASRGLTLHAASNVIYYSQGFSLEDRLQSEDRAHRIGQAKSVLYTDLVAKDTIDEKVIAALRAKMNLADAMLKREDLAQLISACP